ncbi:unnamed protein product [Parnassius apollo]|uniref:(apollo) hypothetical protein n=1 Tax=Parnassius apollo TaxID=110799 RepID=A0A8S3WUX6_PARAO|nr:unnamed protein product [Parnassius apollo]
MKYSPTSNKDTRQSVKFHSRVNIVPDSGICEPVEDINVEISNRGLSGFAIPTQFVKHLVTTDNKLKVTDLESNKQKLDNTDNVSKKSTDRNILEKLKDDINMFIDKKERE